MDRYLYGPGVDHEQKEGKGQTDSRSLECSAVRKGITGGTESRKKANQIEVLLEMEWWGRRVLQVREKMV